MKRKFLGVAVVAVTGLAFGSFFAQQPGESGALGARLDQATVSAMSVSQAAAEGERIFTTPFNPLDGFGDGPIDPANTTDPGGRPTLQGNGMLLRINGLDAQSCLECHMLVSNVTVPATFGIGGAGGTNTNAIIKPTDIDPTDNDLDGAAEFNGRFANPPFVFGAGGVELAGLEMTVDLQALKQQAIDSPGVPVSLDTKGVHFGTIVADGLGNVDTSGVEGVADDLIIRPFGRKGEFATTRDFDLGAMAFHFGMQPTEAVGEGIDSDGDGVIDEITVGEMSALSVFQSTLARPEQARLSDAAVAGEALFSSLDCAACHVPFLDTNTKNLPLRFPQVATDPSANVYIAIDLTKKPADFPANASGGVRVPMFADLKRHDMGAGLAEDFALADEATNSEFTTARLWGVADSGPWMHDGRALTISDAILFHGGEGQAARDAFAALSDAEKMSVLAFLRTLQTPKPSNAGGNNPRTLRAVGRTESRGGQTIDER